VTVSAGRPVRGRWTLAVIPLRQIHGTGHGPGFARVVGRRPTKVAAIALATRVSGWHGRFDGKGRVTKKPAALARNELAPADKTGRA